MSKSKEMLFSVTATDCDWSYYVGPGNGGQKKQKTKSGVICTHRASGAQARSHNARMQLQNKKDAFIKMSETEEFKKWHKIETARFINKIQEKSIDEVVDEEMKKIRVEIQDEDGKWIKE